MVEKIVEVINQKLGGKQTRALNQTGGVKAAADLLNALEKNLSKTLLISIEERNPDLGQQIRQKMFTFEDLNALDDDMFRTVVRRWIGENYPPELRNPPKRLHWHENNVWYFKLAEQGWLCPS